MIRLKQDIDVILGLLDSDGNIVGVERTITDLIAENGVSVLSPRRIQIGEKLHFKTADRQFETYAVVKDIRAGRENNYRLMLEFVQDGGQQHANYWAQFTEGELAVNCQDEFIETAKEVALLLRIVISDATNGEPIDQVFLNDLQEGVDNLRQLVFRLRKV